MMIFAVNLAIAETVNVNQTAILVSDTSSNDSLRLKQAFAQILAKNTGEKIRKILTNPVFKESNIKKGVKRSYFEKIDSKYFQNSSNKFWFHLVMDENFVQKVIQDADFSMLPHRREPIVLWAVKETTENLSKQNDTNSLVKAKLSYAYTDELTMYWINRWAKSLGLDLEMPTIDKSTRRKVSAYSIKSLSYEANDELINRYKINQSLLVYIKHSIDSIKIRTGLVLKGNDMSIKYFQDSSNETKAVEEGELLYSAMLEVAEQYAMLNKISRNDMEKHMVRMVIQSVDNYDQVNLVRQYLNSLSVIDNFDIVSASKGQLILNVNMSINSAAFLRVILRENILEYDNQSPLNQMYFKIVKSEG